MPEATVYRSAAADRALARRRWRGVGQLAYLTAAAYLVAVLMGWL